MGAADNHMAYGLINEIHRTIPNGVHPDYRKKLMEWQYRAEKFIRRNVGYVEGLVLHHWHGSKKNRRYFDRWKILVENQFNPSADLKRDAQGLYQLVDHGDIRSIRLRDQAREYFAERDEDSTSVE
jgi:hypothetical protein